MRFVLPFLTAITIGSCGRSEAAAPKAVQGQLDLRNHDFATGGPVQLDGEWEFHWQKFLSDIKPTEAPAYKRPGAWNDFVHEGTPVGGPGYGTYRLRLLLPESTPELSLRTRDLRSAARIHIGSRTHPLGEPGRDRPATRPFSRPEATPLPPGENQLILSIEIANFHHNTGGMIQSPVLSLRDQSDQSRIAQSVWQGTLAGFFFLFGLYHFILFFNRKENTVLWFGAYCVLISIRTILTGEQIVYLLWRDLDFRLDMAFTYVNLHLLVACGALLIHAMFPEDFKLWIRNGYVAFCLSYTLTVLFLPSEQYSRLLIGFQIPVLVFILYALITIIQATWRGRPSAGLFLFGFGFLAAGAIADILISIFYGYSTPYTAMGLVAAVFAQSVVISQRFSAAFRQVEALYAEALQLRDQVLQSEKLSTIGTMAAGIVHDLKNPVAVIKGYLEMADSDSIGRETRRKFLSTVDQEANRMLALVQDLLDYSQGSVEIQRTWLEAHEYADQVQRTLSPLFQARRVAFILQLDYRGPLQIDPDRFLRVLINIADNAAAVLEPDQKFTLRVMGAPQKVVFELEDNGPGIPPEIQDRLFDPFVTQGKKHGTGLGLAIARSIVWFHNLYEQQCRNCISHRVARSTLSMSFFLPFSIRLGASVMVLSGGIMTAAVLFFYRSTTGLVEEQMVAHVRSMARTGAALLSASQLASIQQLNTLSTKPAPVDLNTLPDGETVDLLSETQIASLQARPDFQGLVQILRRVRAGSQKRVPGPGFLQQAAPPDNEPLIRFVYLAAAIAEEPEHRVVKFLADSSYETIDENNNGVIDDDELPTNIGMLYRIDSQDGFQKAFTGVAAANSELTHDKWGIWISAFAPVIDEAGRTVAVLGVDYDVRSEFNKLQTLWNLCLALILISLIFSLILSILLSRWITRPIDELRSTADQVRLGNLQIRSTLDQKRHDELSLLATTFNEMLVQIEDSIEQQRMAIVELQNAARMKDEFLSNISHEMNTPLAVLVGHLEMVRDGLVRTENLPAIHKILHAQALGLTHILQNIILVTRIESGEIHLKPEGVEPESVLEAVLLRVQASLDRSLSLEREISSQTLVVDRFALETILEELLRNAATHGLSGNPESPIEIRFLSSGISIRDHGAGIAADQIDLVTDRFHRVDSTLTYEVTGIGLGLFICRELCRLLGWTLSLQNHPSGGLDVTVSW